MIKVYLGGNFHTNWRKKVKAALANFPSIEWLEPLTTPDRAEVKDSGNPDWYMLRDLAQLRQADFGFLLIDDHSKRNVGICTEAGILYGRGIPFLLVRLSSIHSYDWVERLAVSTFSNLDDGVEALRFVAL